MTLITDVTRDPAPDVEQSVRVLGRYIAAFEGPNELDNAGDPGWVAKLTAYMPALSAAVREHAPGARLIGPSLVNSSSRLELPGDLPGLFNAHPYPLGQPPEPALGEAVREARPDQLRAGAYFTEFGYHNASAATTGQPPVSEEAAAIYLPRALVAAFGAGVRRTFIYELVDEKPEPGVARSRAALRPAAQRPLAEARVHRDQDADRGAAVLAGRGPRRPDLDARRDRRRGRRAPHAAAARRVARDRALAAGVGLGRRRAARRSTRAACPSSCTCGGRRAT